MTARASVENLLLAGTESLPASGATPACCMAMLIGDEWPTTIAEVVRKGRLEVPDRLRSRLKLQRPEANCPRTSIALAGLFELFPEDVIQPHGGATSVELKGLAAGPWLLGRATARNSQSKLRGPLPLLD